MAKKKRVAAGKRSRKKGKVHENEIAQKLNAWAELPNNEEGSFRRRWSGRGEVRTGGDLIVPDWFPFVVECRHRKGWSFKAVLKNGMESVLLSWWNDMKTKNNEQQMLLIFREQGASDYVMFCGFEHKALVDLFGSRSNPYFVMVFDGVPHKAWVMRFDAFLEWIDPEGFCPNT